jgi:hypothetical protein
MVDWWILFSIDAEHLFNLKFTSKQLQRESKRCEKKEKQNKLKLKHVRTQSASQPQASHGQSSL